MIDRIKYSKEMKQSAYLLFCCVIFMIFAGAVWFYFGGTSGPYFIFFYAFLIDLPLGFYYLWLSNRLSSELPRP